MATRPRTKVEFGDFQTPIALAREVANRIRATGFVPTSIVEPSCGIGNMLLAAVDAFPAFQRAIGVEVQSRHSAELERRCAQRPDRERISVHTDDFFACDWTSLLSALPDPVLVIGNPPWVTNAALSVLGSGNLPRKSNFQGHAGLDALTGKSNFDISEAMLLRIVKSLAGRHAMLAMLCKTAVARKALDHAWRTGVRIGAPTIRRIDSASSFDASVDACLFECRFGSETSDTSCPVFDSLAAPVSAQAIGYRDGRLLADAGAFDRWRHLEGESVYRWRSGIKHDCADVVELIPDGDAFRTRQGEVVDIESEFLFPMLKASDLGNGKAGTPRRWMLVTQRTVGQDTGRIAGQTPKTWAYLQRNAEAFERRASVIYRDRPPFSMFGVGEYSFSPWKVGIAGLSKSLVFRAIGPHAGKPVVLDDTCYFVPCKTEEEADCTASLLNDPVARQFYSAFVFWDAKRPVTVDLLRRLSIRRLAAALGRSAEFEQVLALKVAPGTCRTDAMLWD